MKLPSWYECLENAREASLEVTASVLDAHANLPPRLSERCESCGCEAAQHRGSIRRARDGRGQHHHRGSGDFLFDFLRLSMNHASQLALLSSSYASVASRGLSRLYSRAAPACEPEARCEVALRASARGTDTARFTIRNRLRERAELVIGPPAGGRLTLELEEIGKPGVRRRGDVTVREQSGGPARLMLEPDEARAFLVTLDFRALEADRYYRAELPAHLAGRSKPIHLIVEVFP
jgi:hypothetical protein